MNIITPRPEIFRAYRILFSQGAGLAVGSLGGLDRETLKSAYRRRVLENHPDRALLLNRTREEMEGRFREVNEAYRALEEYLEKEESAVRFWQNAGKWDPVARKWKECPRRLPRVEMVLGQYLYQMRKITLLDLGAALLWQRRQRPHYGELAVSLHILGEKQVEEILSRLKFNERIGRYAMEKGYLDEKENRRILVMQRMLQRPLGEYFVEKKILGADEIEELVDEMKRHNASLRQ